MNDTQDASEDRIGQFGYAALGHKRYIPYIFHGKEKVCATKVFQWHIDELHIQLNPMLAQFPYLLGNEMSSDDAALYNEINQWHNNYLYPITFRASDTMLKLCDACDIYEFVLDCNKKSTFGEKYDMDAGLMQIKWKAPPGIADEFEYTVWPYISKDKKRYVPITFLADSTSALSATIVLDGIDVMYMRYMYTVLKYDVPKSDFRIPCVELDDALAQIRSATDMTFEFDENYWPTKKRQPSKAMPLPVLLGSHIKKLNNNNLAFFTQAEATVVPAKQIPDVMTATATKAMTPAVSNDVDNETDANSEKENQKVHTSILLLFDRPID